MKIHLLVVDNQKDTDENTKNIIKYVESHIKGAICTQVVGSHYDQETIISIRPDLVIMDVALLQDEEKLFDEASKENSKLDSPKTISGIEYCRSIKTNFANIPVILMSNYFHPEILSAAFEAGADAFIYKKQVKHEHVISTIKSTFYRGKTDDIVFYERLRELLENGSAWNREDMLQAVEAFFTRGSGVRGLTALWCSLSGIVEKHVSTKASDKLLRALLDCEAILLAANPGMRDHVKHAGNVFWTGYYFLNKLDCFRDPTKLPGFSSNGFSSSSTNTFESLNIAWILASLLHDVGYLRDRLQGVENRLNRAHELFCEKSEARSLDREGAPNGLNNKVREYLNNMGPEGKLLWSAISKTIDKWGTMHGDVKIEDHGIASAAAFINQMDDEDFKLRKAEILHATAAIALHHLPKWNRYWLKDDPGLVMLPIGLLPIAWLLSYCDEIQAWGREPGNDPFDSNKIEDIGKAREEYRKGYLQGSKLVSFNVEENSAKKLKANVDIGIQYLVVHGENIMSVGDNIRGGIEKWHREHSGILRQTLALDELIQTTLTHSVPSAVVKPIVIKLDERDPV